MEPKTAITLNQEAPLGQIGARDIVAVGFRHKRVLLGTFIAFMAVSFLALWLVNGYQSEAKVLLTRGRLDPSVSPEQDSRDTFGRQVITEEELNSEIDLMGSQDLLRQVVLECRLQDLVFAYSPSRFLRPASVTEEEWKIGKAMQKLDSHLDIGSAKKSNVIVAQYTAKDPQLSAKVLRTLTRVYLQKHAEVHRPAGQFEFFDRETQHYHSSLANIEARLAKFPRENPAISGQAERDLTVQKLADLRVSLQQTRSAMADAKNRIAMLEREMASTPDRLTTQVHKADNPQLMQTLQGTLLNLELKRSELLEKYKPTYRLVQEVEREIKKTQAAIQEALASPATETTTDRDPTHDWIRGELAKVRTELHGLQAREAETQAGIRRFEEAGRQFNETGFLQHDLEREAKALEDNYKLYLQKREEARIADALDRNNILSISVAEQAIVPSLPRFPWTLAFVMLIAGSVFFSTASVFVAEYLDTSLRTPAEVQQWLGVPVLAALPKPSEPIPGNGV